MDANEILKALEAAGTAQTRKTFMRHGVKDPMFGVLRSAMKPLQKQVKINHPAALALWASGNFDARVFATFIADPSQVTLDLIKAWAKDLSDYGTTDALSELITTTEHPQTILALWADDAGEWTSRLSWHMLGHLASSDPSLPDSFFIAYIAQIEREIHTRKNRVRQAMNLALISIGLRNDTLEAIVIAAAERIGVVEVDHGDTDCKTPYAIDYIARTKAYRAAQAAKKADPAKRRKSAVKI